MNNLPEKILIINSAEPEVYEFYQSIENILSRLNYPYQSIEYKEIQNLNLDFYKGVIITGSPMGNDIVSHHLPYFQWLKIYNKPVLGICAGHHITGILYGAKLLRSKEPEYGDLNIKIVKNDLILNNIRETMTVKQMHNDSITLPDNFDLLATSDTCEVQMIRHKQKPLYTCQFHPEFYNHIIFKNFLNLID